MAVDAATIARRLTEMDRQGIDLHVLSVHPGQFFYWADADLSARIIKTQNEKIAEICAARPERFVGLGAVSIQHPAQVAAEMDYAVAKLGLRGFILGGNINGDELADPKFDPFWKKAEELRSRRSSSIRRSPISAASDWPARARWPIPSGSRWTPPSRWRT